MPSQETQTEDFKPSTRNQRIQTKDDTNLNRTPGGTHVTDHAGEDACDRTRGGTHATDHAEGTRVTEHLEGIHVTDHEGGHM